MQSQTPPARRGPKPNPDTRKNLIRVGMRMFHEAGYAATGLKDVVSGAKVPKGSFYNHFESKETFGKEVIDFYFDSGLVLIREILTDSNSPPLARLKHYFDDRIDAFKTNGFVRGCLMGNLSLEIADHSEAIRDTIATHFETWSGLIADCIAEAQKSGAISNSLAAPLLAQFILNSWEGALLRMRTEKTDRPLTEFREVVFGSLLT
ncbi:TetR family transcriptional regulator [Pseudomonas sp. WN033]|nr:TetR family transcriptional regulator [Pseudomonas sp. WN033]